MVIEVVIPVDAIVDWPTFHNIAAGALGFPDWYGRNSGAWDDLLFTVGPASGMPFEVSADDVLCLVLLGDIDGFQRRVPDVFEFVHTSVARVNGWRRDAEMGPQLMIAYDDRSHHGSA